MSEMHTIGMRPIGIVRTPHKTPVGTPVQPTYARQFEGEIILDEELEPALSDIDGFERLWLIFWLDRAGPFEPLVVPYRDTKLRGLFATRAPSRPNPIGLSVVRLLGRDRHVLRVGDVDLLDGTPLLDIKPYFPDVDAHPGAKAGWADDAKDALQVADQRFHRT